MYSSSVSSCLASALASAFLRRLRRNLADLTGQRPMRDKRDGQGESVRRSDLSFAKRKTLEELLSGSSSNSMN